MGQYHIKSKRMKELWDEKSKERSFVVGDEVLLRKPGLGVKLQESWEGPYKVVRVNSPLSYELDIEGRRKSSIHVQLLKQYVRRQNYLLVKRVTTVLEPDAVEDQIESTYSNFKEINKITDPQPFYMPTVSEVLEAVGKAEVVSKIDLSKGYYQIPLKDSDIQKMTFV